MSRSVRLGAVEVDAAIEKLFFEGDRSKFSLLSKISFLLRHN